MKEREQVTVLMVSVYSSLQENESLVFLTSNVSKILRVIARVWGKSVWAEKGRA
jgi:hypothetical protein